MAGTSGIKRPLTDEIDRQLDEVQAKVAKTTGNYRSFFLLECSLIWCECV